MADQRPFRFRLPWLSAPAPPAPRPTAEPQPPRPTVGIQAPARPTPTIPIQRPPFRPAGIAPAPLATTQPTGQERAEPQPVSPLRATTKSLVTSPPASPSRATTETQARSVPASPSRETRAASVPPSPSRATPRSRAVSVPPSPSRTTSQPQPAVPTVPQPQSPSRLASRVTQVQPTVSQSPSKPAISLPLSQVPQQKTEITAKTVPQPQQQGEPIQALAGVRAATPTPTSVPALETPAASQKSDSKTIGVDHPVPLPEPVKKVKEDIFERKKTTGRPSVSNGEKVPLYKEIREDISKFAHKLGTEQIKQPVGEKPVSIVTLAGENRGASMYVGSEPTRKDGSVHIHRGYKINPDESSEATTDGEGSSKGKSSKDLLTKEDPARKAYINSNTQSVNNSILFESSVNEGSPGVQLSLSYNDEEPSKYGTKSGPLETHKAEFKVTPAEKLTYEPTVKRRCLRGLLLESSDSDPDNPEKPRRHGCRYDCAQKGKEKDIGVL
ncbi:unnamed protein product [Dovyalis caffra]|uniref:Uncharacterized protein n=1 Tax=Dovyalis caffra TaxID=77055 RepID=A0AAV1S647_9ROSI|nr:unnamed protein product [Dovyalis caffra]